MMARARAQEAKALRARRQHEFGDLFDEPIVEEPAHLAETAVVGKQPGSKPGTSIRYES